MCSQIPGRLVDRDTGPIGRELESYPLGPLKVQCLEIDMVFDWGEDLRVLRHSRPPKIQLIVPDAERYMMDVPHSRHPPTDIRHGSDHDECPHAPSLNGVAAAMSIL